MTKTMKDALKKEVFKAMNNTGFTTTLYINGFKAVDNYIDNSKVMKELGEALEEGGVITLKLVTDDGNIVWKWGSLVNFTAYLCGRLPEDQDFTVTFNNIFISFGDKAEAIAVAESVFEGTKKGELEIKHTTENHSYVRMWIG